MATSKTRYYKTEGDPTGLVRDGRSGIYYYRTGRVLPISLRTKDRSEAIKLRDIAAARGRLVELDNGPLSLKKTVEIWRKMHQDDPDNFDAAFDAEIDRRRGDPVRYDVNEYDEGLEVYDKAREADALAFSGLVQGTRVPVAFYVDDYIAARNMKVRYAYRTKRAIAQLTGFMEGRANGDNIKTTTRKDVSDFLIHLAETEKSLTTAKAKRSSLSNYWDWLVTRDDATVNVWAGHKMPKGEGKADVRSYSEEEIRALLYASDAQPMADFIRFAALTGMRREEIGGLRVSDCTNGWLTVRVGKTKNATRRLPIHPDLVSVTERRTKDKEPEAFLFHDLPKSGSVGRGRTEKIGERFTHYRRSAGVDDLRPDGRSRVDFHSFRRWFITEAVRHSGQPESVVSEIVGHSEGKIAKTLGVYYGGSLDSAKMAVIQSVRLPSP